MKSTSDTTFDTPDADDTEMPSKTDVDADIDAGKVTDTTANSTSMDVNDNEVARVDLEYGGDTVKAAPRGVTFCKRDSLGQAVAEHGAPKEPTTPGRTRASINGGTSPNSPNGRGPARTRSSMMKKKRSSLKPTFFTGFNDLREDMKETRELTDAQRRRELCQRSDDDEPNQTPQSRNLDKSLTDQEFKELMGLGQNHAEIVKDRDIRIAAKTKAIHHTATGAILFFFLFQVGGVAFFVYYGGLTLVDAMLFSMYTITTAGFGSVPIPLDDMFFLEFVIVFMLMGLAALTILVSQVYQLIALETRNVKVTDDKGTLARKGLLCLEKKLKEIENSPGSSGVLDPNQTVDSDSMVDAFTETTAIQEGKEELVQAAKKLRKLERVEQKLGSSRNPFSIVFLQAGRAIRRLADLNEPQWAVLILSYFFGLFAVGVGALMHLEDWNFTEAMYFVTYCQTSVGFGDIAPNTDGGKLFVVFWIGTNVSFISLYMGNLGRYYMMACNWNVSRVEKYMLLKEGKDVNLDTNTVALSTLEKTADDQSTLHSFHDILDFLYGHLSDEKYRNDPSLAQFLTLKAVLKRSPVFQANNARRPSFALLTLVQERLAQIIAIDVAGHQSSFEAKDTELSTTIDSLDETIEKWMLPMGCHQNFRAVAFDTLLYVGEKKLVVNGPEAILALPPSDVHLIFGPVLVALQDAGTMASWLARTELLARESFVRAPTVVATAVGQADKAVLIALANEYRTMLERKQIQSMARFTAYRHTAMLAVANMAVFYALMQVVLMTVAEVSFRDALLYTTYLITSAGFGTVPIPMDGFLWFVIVFTFVGITSTAILAAQVFQYMELKSVHVRHAQDKATLASEGLEDLASLAPVSGHPTEESSTEVPVEEIIRREIVAALKLVPQAPNTVTGQRLTKRVFDLCKKSELLSILAVPMYLVFLLLFGAIVMSLLEGWTFVQGLYSSTFMMTTIGYGDKVPESNAGIWFVIFYLPTNVSFLALYLGNVAHYYVLGSRKYMAYLEVRMRKQLRAGHDEVKQLVAKEAIAEIQEGQDEPDEEQAVVERGMPPKRASRRDRIRQNSNFSTTSVNSGMFDAISGFFSPVDDDDEADPAATLAMRDVLRVIHQNKPKSTTQSGAFDLQADCDKEEEDKPEGKLALSLFEGTIDKPSLALRFLVIERAVYAIANDVAGFESSVEIVNNTFIAESDNLKSTADKWLIPSRARLAFRSVAFESLFFVGERQLLLQLADGFFDLNPFEMDEMFAPFLVAMGDSEAMEAWLASTEGIVAECYQGASNSERLTTIEEVDASTSQAEAGNSSTSHTEALMARRSLKNSVEGCFPCNPGNAVLIKL